MNSWRLGACLALAVCFAFHVQTAHAATATISASKDVTLYESATGALANGAGDRFFVGRTGQVSESIRRGLITFDISAGVPAGALVTGVSLKLRMSKTSSAASTVTMKRVTSDWGEATSDAPGEEGAGTTRAVGDATWLHTFYPGSAWTSPGGDFTATVSASISVSGTGFYTFGSTPQLVADVQDMLDNPGTNFGWILLGNESSASTAKRFDSRTIVTSANRPELTVTYVPITTVTLNPSKDGTLFESATGALANGSGEYLFAGRTNQGSDSKRRALLAFNVAGTIPADAMVQEASLDLNMNQTSISGVLLKLHRATADWGEGASDAPGAEGGGAVPATGDATWLHTFYNTSTWASAGGDYNPTETGSTLMTYGGIYSFSSGQLVTDVQDMLDNPGGDYGWMIVGDETAPQTAKRFGSRENSNPANRPALVVGYWAPTPTQTPTATPTATPTPTPAVPGITPGGGAPILIALLSLLLMMAARGLRVVTEKGD